MGSYQPQVANNDYGMIPGKQAPPPIGVNLLADDDLPARPQAQPAQQLAGHASNPFGGEEDLLGGVAAPSNPPPQHRNIKIPMSTVVSADRGASGLGGGSQSEAKRT